MLNRCVINVSETRTISASSSVILVNGIAQFVYVGIMIIYLFSVGSSGGMLLFVCFFAVFTRSC